MILNSTPDNQAVLSNVQQTSAFAIKATAKSFHILSNGLYANKIRAIIRELSCNAVDSHKAAGRPEVPFDVHLPNTLEPWFSIRDYGVGLNHHQVINIYTTYFESTKTDSNDFIGALGLGSKSPFSYTDNFTVTAIRDGRRGIYTAFINDQGIPSIALMMEEETSDPNGVEVKFSVNSQWDFDRFAHEAQYVYQYFDLRPVVKGRGSFSIPTITYQTRDIIPGVHHIGLNRTSTAIMGNICYPIEIPESDKSLGSLRKLLSCGLEMHFKIGELDFQASREGLSYIPQTINAIKNKLNELNVSLIKVLSVEAEKIDNLWERAVFLHNRSGVSLWQEAVRDYIKAKPIPTITDTGFYVNTTSYNLTFSELAAKYNIAVRAFNVIKHNELAKTLTTQTKNVMNSDGTETRLEFYILNVGNQPKFVINDMKTGGQTRAKNHFKLEKSNQTLTEQNVFVLSPADRTRAMNLTEFFNSIDNPPESLKIKISEMHETDRRTAAPRNVGIQVLETRGTGGYYRREEMVWRFAGKSDDFSDTKIYYYVPLNGHKIVSKYSTQSATDLYETLNDCGLNFKFSNIYGIRKTDLDWVKEQDNWINLEDFVAENINKNFEEKKMALVAYNVNIETFRDLPAAKICNNISPESKFYKAWEACSKLSRHTGNYHHAIRVIKNYGKAEMIQEIDKLVCVYNEMLNALNKYYPMLQYVRGSVDANVICDYIKLMDNTGDSK